MTRAALAALGGLDPVIHPAKRLAAMALLSVAADVDFPYLKEQLGISDSDLSKQMSALADAGYVDILKAGRGRGASTRYRLTRSGKAAYRAHRAALRALLADADAEGDAGAPPHAQPHAQSGDRSGDRPGDWPAGDSAAAASAE